MSDDRRIKNDDSTLIKIIDCDDLVNKVTKIYKEILLVKGSLDGKMYYDDQVISKFKLIVSKIGYIKLKKLINMLDAELKQLNQELIKRTELEEQAFYNELVNDYFVPYGINLPQEQSSHIESSTVVFPGYWPPGVRGINECKSEEHSEEIKLILK